LGSNVFNSLAVGGVIALLGSGGDSHGLTYRYGVPIMVAVSTLAWIFMVVRKRVSKPEAGILLAVYVFAIVLISETSAGEAIRGIIEGMG
jgi:Ca2+/Na+ antiporter